MTLNYNHMELYKQYTPITAAPFRCSDEYMEFAPCEALKPYIRCFWGTRVPVTQMADKEVTGVVTPDTCMDIIFTVDFTNNQIDSQFCGIDDRTFTTHSGRWQKRTLFCFAIRFYAWGVSLFAKESMKNTKNAFFDAGCHFPGIKKELEKRLFDAADMRQFIPVAEKILLQHFDEKYKNPAIFQAFSRILAHRGNLAVTDLSQEVLVSSRQLERLFLEYIGSAPKSLASMVRYQYLWNELLYNRDFNIADAVYKYGYSDQAHLCHDFKKYHSMNLSEAKKYALQNVANIQDSFCGLQYSNKNESTIFKFSKYCQGGPDNEIL